MSENPSTPLSPETPDGQTLILRLKDLRDLLTDEMVDGGYMGHGVAKDWAATIDLAIQRAEDADTLRPQNGEAGIVADTEVPAVSLYNRSATDAPVMTIIDYCTEEVRRQGHDVTVMDGTERVMWMLDAWLFAQSLQNRPDYMRGIHWFDVRDIGKRIGQQKNAGGFRQCEVRVGSKKCPAASRVRKLLDILLEQQSALTPLEFYKAFEEIHPFVDGNGRTGKVLLNWLNGTLHAPIFPPANLWGREIQNP